MDTHQTDWNYWRAFLATAQTGSLSAGARQLGLSQPTLSRQVSALESALNVVLFDRIGKSLVLTETGRQLLPHVKTMEQAALDLDLAVTVGRSALKGRITLSLSDALAAYVLPEMLAQLRSQAPDLTISILAENKLSDLRRREADIAIRHVRPEEPELIARWVGDVRASFFASRDWIHRHGNPDTADQIRAEDLLAFDDPRFAAHLQTLGFDVRQSDFRLVTTSSATIWEMIRKGLGIGNLFRCVATRDPEVVQVLRSVPDIVVPVWLVTHRELRTSLAHRLVFDHLATAFASIIDPRSDQPPQISPASGEDGSA